MVFKARWPLHHAACHHDSWQAILSRLFTELKDRRLGHTITFLFYFSGERGYLIDMFTAIFPILGVTHGTQEACKGKTQVWRKQYRS